MSEFKLSKIGNVLLGVTDMQRSVTFYRDQLGLPVTFSAGEFTFFDAGGLGLALRGVRTLAPADDARVEIVFHVDDVRAAYDALKARGVPFRIEPRVVTGDQYAADFRDPDGHVLSIFGKSSA